jgi:fermentation-respiration switch protein FrsA (DUF1100 family)
MASHNAASQSDSPEFVNARPSLLRKLIATSWRFARLVLIVYLVVVLGMMLLERKLIYPAPPLEAGDWKATHLRHEEVWFTSADGTKLHGWFFPRANAKRAILYCHGNGEDVAAVGEVAAELGEQLNTAVFIFDYRGYGHSQGKPDEPGCIADGNAAQHWLAHHLSIHPSEVILMGRSLGSALAVALAAENGARALILQNAFSRMTDVAALHYPWLPVRLLMSNRYDNLAAIQKYNGPFLQSHGTSDELIPFRNARELFDTAPSTRKKWIVHRNLGHNSPLRENYLSAVAAFLETSEESSSATKTP